VQLVLDGLVRRHVGGEEREVFLDPARLRPELLELDANLEVIQEELRRVLPAAADIPRYHEADAAQETISGNDEKAWRVFFLHFYWADERFPHRVHCPRTTELVAGIPGVLQGFFSILEPRKSVPAHSGPGLHYLRYHTALVVPRENPPSIRVKDRHHTWKVGTSLLFDDSHDHEVTNEADEPRVVLIVDVLRPLPWHLHALNLFLRWLRTPARKHHPELYERVRVPVEGAAASGG
jgi:aspartyl/asparaginyl beta-hydroxylase (cupin superfamily)